jgi:hypothetical protein
MVIMPTTIRIALSANEKRTRSQLVLPSMDLATEGTTAHIGKTVLGMRFELSGVVRALLASIVDNIEPGTLVDDRSHSRTPLRSDPHCSSSARQREAALGDCAIFSKPCGDSGVAMAAPVDARVHP